MGTTFMNNLGQTPPVLMVNALPTAGPLYEGMTAALLGGTGVKDFYYVCLKKADDSFMWKEIVNGA